MEFTFELTNTWIIIFILNGFIVGYIDSIAGGEGMIQVPILLSIPLALFFLLN